MVMLGFHQIVPDEQSSKKKSYILFQDGSIKILICQMATVLFSLQYAYDNKMFRDNDIYQDLGLQAYVFPVSIFFSTAKNCSNFPRRLYAQLMNMWQL